MNKVIAADLGTQRILMWLGIVLGAVLSVALGGLMQMFPLPPGDLPADQVVHIYADHNVRFKIGVMLAILSAGFLVPITVVTSLQMARLEKGLPIWAIMQGLLGVVGTAALWLPVLVWGWVSYSPDRAPELTLLLHEFAILLLITPLSLFPMQLLTVIVIALKKDEPDAHSAFPRWLGYLTIWVLVQSLGGPICLLFKNGIFAWNGLIPFWLPMLVFVIWIVAICNRLLHALSYQQASGAQADRS